jgi:hypothetical protein
MSEPFDYRAWAGIPRQLIMPRAFPRGSREAERGPQPQGPGEADEGIYYYEPRIQPREISRPDYRPGYEIREPPQQNPRRRARVLPVLPETDQVEEGKAKRPEKLPPDPFFFDKDEDVKLKAKNPLPKSSQPSRVRNPSVYGGEPRLRICPSNYTAMEIHGFFGLIDDGPVSAGRMLIVHVPSWVKGYFLDLRDGENIYAAHVNGKVGGVLRVLAVGRHRYYSPGSKVSTCTVCVPEEQWEKFGSCE